MGLCNWKMLFSLNLANRLKKCYSQKKKRKNFQIHPAISLNNIQVERASQHKHQGILLDEKLNFKQQDIVCHGNP